MNAFIFGLQHCNCKSCMLPQTAKLRVRHALGVKGAVLGVGLVQSVLHSATL